MKTPLIWRRNRGSTPTLRDDQLKAAWQVASLLLEYPTPELIAQLPVLRSVVEQLPAQVRDPFQSFLRAAEATALEDLQADYVDVFDVTRKCSLHLTYFTHGDTRRRGVALVEFKQAFRRAGVELADDSAELPDFLPVVLEFGAFTDNEAAWKLLNDYRVGLELLHVALQRNESRWLAVIDAVRATLPSLGDDDHEALAMLIAQGPPSEDVGLDTSPYSMDPRLSPALNPRPEPVDLGSNITVGAP